MSAAGGRWRIAYILAEYDTEARARQYADNMQFHSPQSAERLIVVNEAGQAARADMLLKVLADLVTRVDTDEDRPAGNLDTAWAHAVLAECDPQMWGRPDQAAHEADDPHCTCNDCIESHARRLQDGSTQWPTR